MVLPSVASFACELKGRGYYFSFTFGSGGYFVELFDTRLNKKYSTFSWDVDEAIRNLVEDSEVERMGVLEEDTRPGVSKK